MFEVSVVALVHHGVLMKKRITFAFCDFVAASVATVMTVVPRPMIMPEEIVTEPPAGIVEMVPCVVFPSRMMPPDRLIHQGTLVSAADPLLWMTALTLNNPPVIAPIWIAGLITIVRAGDCPLMTPYSSFAIAVISYDPTAFQAYDPVAASPEVNGPSHPELFPSPQLNR